MVAFTFMSISPLIHAQDTGYIPVVLKCEHLKNPVGLGTERPRLSWQTKVDEVDHPFVQESYRIAAATTIEDLDLGRSLLWDSGRVQSSEQVLVPWGGDALEMGERVFWKVQVWDSEGNPSEWSDPAVFTIGPLQESDWQGEWLRHPYVSEEERARAALFRKDFHLDEVPRHAEVNLVTEGMHVLYINGRRVGDRLLSPMLSSQKRLLFVTYDVCEYLQEGDNRIGIMLSRGFFRDNQAVFSSLEEYSVVVPKVRLQLMGEGRPILTTNRDWQCKLGRRDFHSHQMQVVSDKLLSFPFGGEYVDAGLPDALTEISSRTEEGWSPALVSEAPDKVVSAEQVEPDRVIETIRPQSIKPFQHDGRPALRIDFGKHFTGFLDLELAGGDPGAAINIFSSDLKDEIINYNQNSKLRLGPDGRGRFRHEFNFCAGRYVTLIGKIDTPDATNLRAEAVGNDRRQIGQFQSSNALLNQIFATDVWTYQANTFNGITVDCPHRERRGYGLEGGMANITVGPAIFESGAFLNKWLQDWMDVQRTDGYFPHNAPRADLGGGPLWSMAPVFVTYNHYINTGDPELLTRIYPRLKDLLEYLDRQVDSKDGLLPDFEEPGRFRGLGDWCRPHPGERPGGHLSFEDAVKAAGKRWELRNTPAALHYNNCAYGWILQMMEYLAQEAGKTDDAKVYGERLGSLRKAIHQKYYNPEKRNYVDTDQMRQGFALLAGVPPMEERELVVESLVDDITGAHPYFDTGNSTPLFIRILTETVNRPDIVLDVLLREDYPGYAWLLNQGATTWPEYWDFDKSQIHTTYTGISWWFIHGLGGIRPDPAQPGYGHFFIKPLFSEKLEWVDVSHESLFGNIRSAWIREGDMIVLNVEVPANSRATIAVPVRSKSEVDYEGTEGTGGMASEISGHLEFSVGSGTHRFQFPAAAKPESKD